MMLSPSFGMKTLPPVTLFFLQCWNPALLGMFATAQLSVLVLSTKFTPINKHNKDACDTLDVSTSSKWRNSAQGREFLKACSSQTSQTDGKTNTLARKSPRHRPLRIRTFPIGDPIYNGVLTDKSEDISFQLAVAQKFLYWTGRSVVKIATTIWPSMFGWVYYS